MQFPKRITLELTNFCNLHCVFCPRRFMEAETGFMDVEMARDLMAEMGEQDEKVAVVPFFRGESLTHPKWDIILAGLHEFNLGPIQMATNGSLLTRERAQKLLDIGVDTLSFSMDTTDPELYRELRGSDYKNSLDNVLRFLEMRAKRPEGCRTVQVSAVETDRNRSGIDVFIKFWRGKADRIRIYPEHSKDGEPGSLAGKESSSQRQPCHKVFEDMAIYWNGQVGLCNHDWTRMVTGQKIGSVRDGGIKAVWNSGAYEDIRIAHETGRLEGIAPCEHCGHYGRMVGKTIESLNSQKDKKSLHNL